MIGRTGPGTRCSRAAGLPIPGPMRDDTQVHGLNRVAFADVASRAPAVTLVRRLLSDQVTPVAAYRRLVAVDARTQPSFLCESVVGGDQAGRYSHLGARPALLLTAHGPRVHLCDHRTGAIRRLPGSDPLDALRTVAASWTPAGVVADPGPALPRFLGGWVGWAGFDTVRYLEPEKLPFAQAPTDDRGLPDLAFGLYDKVAVFDHATKILHACVTVRPTDFPSTDAAWRAGTAQLDELVERLETPGPVLPAGSIVLDTGRRPVVPQASTLGQDAFESIVQRARAYIAEGDIFQVVLSQRFTRHSSADPFDVYRTLRVVNPSPYMYYVQGPGTILIGASPEILCRAEGRLVVNRPLAGTRPRGADAVEDAALERELRADQKECAEHIMLVDLGRNDLGRVCEPGSIRVERVMEVERYSHVMHLSSTVTGRLAPGCDAWDLLRHTLPVGTVSGAPKVRAIQIIDELEPVRRGPYAGGVGQVAFGGDMDIAIALRTIVVPVEGDPAPGSHPADGTDVTWRYDIQAGAGIVADSVPAREFEETVSKAAALGRAIDLAEAAFPAPREPVAS